MTADEIIRRLALKPHPKEAGYFVETHRSEGRISREALPAYYGGDRCCSTAIYFLLKAGSFSEMHRLHSEEIWHHYGGAPAEMLLLLPDGSGKILRLGNRLDADESPQVVVPRRAWQGVTTVGDYTLFGCTVAPGFEYSDYESGNGAALIQRYPQFAERIKTLTR
jgi:predicted cupin superfamily sugar epimerase